MFLKLVENDLYYFDAAAAERAVRFIEKYLCHYEDAFAGKPFLLMPWQKQIVRDLFGWKRKADGLRRFREVFLLTPKGQGKTPFITAISLYLFFGEKKQGQQFFSVATDFNQAKLTFDSAKNMISASPRLAARVRLKDREIVFADRKSVWQIISGTAEGKAGFRPDCICADEVWEWSGRKLYDNIEANLFKRQEPMMLLASNMGMDQNGVWYQLWKRAEALFAGKSNDDRLYPVIFAAPKDAAIDDEKVWAQVNPGLGVTIRLGDLRHKCKKAMQDTAELAKFKRLHLSQFVQGSSKWLDMARWDAAVGPVKVDLSKLPLYMGLDLSVCDDLSSVAAVWIGKIKLYVKIWTYVPAGSAAKYEKRDEVPFSQWAKDGHVRLIESATVDDLAQKRIANLILKVSKKGQFKTLGYDKFRASAVVAQCERGGLACVPVQPNYEGMSAGCHELDRRLKVPTIVLPDNPCTRWQAANVEVIVDHLGNIRPVKENSGGTYTGRRGSKIDCIVSLVIALSQAKRHEFNQGDANAAALAAWDGKIQFA
jgi:phage terminase large subunit-like protein